MVPGNLVCECLFLSGRGPGLAQPVYLVIISRTVGEQELRRAVHLQSQLGVVYGLLLVLVGHLSPGIVIASISALETPRLDNPQISTRTYPRVLFLRVHCAFEKHCIIFRLTGFF